MHFTCTVPSMLWSQRVWFNSITFILLFRWWSMKQLVPWSIWKMLSHVTCVLLYPVCALVDLGLPIVLNLNYPTVYTCRKPTTKFAWTFLKNKHLFLVLQLFLSSPRPTLRFAAVRTLNKVAMIQPASVTSCNLDLENLITDVNRSIATLAITTLLKVLYHIQTPRSKLIFFCVSYALVC